MMSCVDVSERDKRSWGQAEVFRNTSLLESFQKLDEDLVPSTADNKELNTSQSGIPRVMRDF